MVFLFAFEELDSSGELSRKYSPSRPVGNKASRALGPQWVWRRERTDGIQLGAELPFAPREACEDLNFSSTNCIRIFKQRKFESSLQSVIWKILTEFSHMMGNRRFLILNTVLREQKSWGSYSSLTHVFSYSIISRTQAHFAVSDWKMGSLLVNMLYCSSWKTEWNSCTSSNP